MALVVEDGTGLSTAESYISVADTNTYLQNKGDSTAWDAATTTAKEQALRIGTEYLDATYRFRGTPLYTTQALRWPRYPVTIDGLLQDSDSIPTGLKRACAEVAKLHIEGTTLYEDVLTTPGTVVEATDVVGDLRTTRKYEGGSQMRIFPWVTRLMSQITYAGKMERS